MNTPLAVFGAVASVATLAMLYYNYKVVKAFRENKDLAATKMILKDEVPKAFRNLSIAALIFSAGSLVGAFSLLTDISALSYFSEIGGLAMITGFLLFMREIFRAVAQVKEEEEE